MIVIGGSLGGMQSVQQILSALPADLPVPIAIALHRGRDEEDRLTPLLQRNCALPVSEAVDKMPLEAGQVYIAPCDYHLLVEPDCLSLSVEDRVNHARPSIDVLFESAAFSHAERAIAVVLSGAGSDGAHGAKVIEARGGTVLIEDPALAHRADMPAAVLATTAEPLVLPLRDIAVLLVELTERQRGDSP